MTTTLPGTVLVVRDHGIWAWWIRVGAWLRRQPHRWNHVVIAHHVDTAGTYWGVEGRPGGVGWRDLSTYLNDSATINNGDQLLAADDQQRELICQAVEALLDARYDWPAIIRDGLAVVDPLWRQRDQWGTGVPGHVVCSSMADWAYEHVGLATPAADRWCTPSDWAAFIAARGWTG